jgi:hypothetical protein
MKKILCIVLTIILLSLTLTSCSKSNEQTKNSSKDKTNSGIKDIKESNDIEDTSVNTLENSSEDALIEKIDSNYYKYPINSTVYFDIDDDGVEEKITYEAKEEEVANHNILSIEGYDPIDIYQMNGENYFIIIKFSDKFDTNMNMIGTLENGPSCDPLTNFYTIISPQGQKVFTNVGSVEGILVPNSQYNPNNKEDFDYKAVLLDNVGIEAPVRLEPFAGTWFGRNIFTYYSTYCSLIDNINKYNLDYITNIILNVENSVNAYSKKDLNSSSIIINDSQEVTLTATDNKKWVYMKTTDGTEGWINVKDITDTNFSGFLAYD